MAISKINPENNPTLPHLNFGDVQKVYLSNIRSFSIPIFQVLIVQFQFLGTSSERFNFFNASLSTLFALCLLIGSFAVDFS